MSLVGSIQHLFKGNPAELNPRELKMPGGAQFGGATGIEDPNRIAKPASGESFGKIVDQFVSSVDAKMQAANAEKAKVLSGESTNLHQAMIAMQEASVSFSLMVEVRNKLVESYQELMRMQV